MSGSRETSWRSPGSHSGKATWVFFWCTLFQCSSGRLCFLQSRNSYMYNHSEPIWYSSKGCCRYAPSKGHDGRCDEGDIQRAKIACNQVRYVDSQFPNSTTERSRFWRTDIWRSDQRQSVAAQPLWQVSHCSHNESDNTDHERAIETRSKRCPQRTIQSRTRDMDLGCLIKLER